MATHPFARSLGDRYCDRAHRICADQQAASNLVQAQSNRYADTSALFQDLGGGWWNRADIPKS
jgi:hypothetical protein